MRKSNWVHLLPSLSEREPRANYPHLRLALGSEAESSGTYKCQPCSIIEVKSQKMSILAWCFYVLASGDFFFLISPRQKRVEKEGQNNWVDPLTSTPILYICSAWKVQNEQQSVICGFSKNNSRNKSNFQYQLIILNSNSSIIFKNCMAN